MNASTPANDRDDGRDKTRAPEEIDAEACAEVGHNPPPFLTATGLLAQVAMRVFGGDRRLLGIEKKERFFPRKSVFFEKNGE